MYSTIRTLAELERAFLLLYPLFAADHGRPNGDGVDGGKGTPDVLVIESLSGLCAHPAPPVSAKDTPTSNTSSTSTPPCSSPLYRQWHIITLGWLRLQSVAGHRHV